MAASGWTDAEVLLPARVGPALLAGTKLADVAVTTTAFLLTAKV